MSDVWLGKTPPIGAERDATHVAVVPMVAAHQLMPGVHVGIVEDGRAGVEAENKIGIVDPFLARPVSRGERFYLCLYPQSVSGLRHVYTHPALDNASTASTASTLDAARATQKQTSEQWLRDFCDRVDCPGYESVIAKAVEHQSKSNYYDDDAYLHFSGDDAHGEIPPEFWEHAEIVTGRKLTKRPEYFSCAC